MLIDGINLAEGSDIINAVVTKGTTSPSNPNVGELFFNTTSNKLTIYDGSWNTLLSGTMPYDIAGSIFGKPDNAAVVARVVVVRPFNLPANLTGSIAKCDTAATAAQILTLKKNGSSIGTINFAGAATTGTFTFVSQVSFAAGDVLTVVNQTTADATFADAEFTLIANLL